MSKAIQHHSSSPQHRRVRPVVDVYESDAGYQVHVELPGVKNDDVQLTLEKDTVHLEARRNAHLSEPIVYDRIFSLPDVVDREGVKAQLELGVLTLELPKRPSDQPRQISVTAA